MYTCSTLDEKGNFYPRIYVSIFIPIISGHCQLLEFIYWCSSVNNQGQKLYLKYLGQSLVHGLCVCVCVCVLVAQLCPILCNPMAPLSMGFSRQENWSRLPFLSPLVHGSV